MKSKEIKNINKQQREILRNEKWTQQELVLMDAILNKVETTMYSEKTASMDKGEIENILQRDNLSMEIIDGILEHMMYPITTVLTEESIKIICVFEEIIITQKEDENWTTSITFTSSGEDFFGIA